MLANGPYTLDKTGHQVSTCGLNIADKLCAHMEVYKDQH